VTVNSASHVGWHIVPLTSVAVQSPTPPFSGAAEASHAGPEVSRQKPDVSTPASHALGPVTA
jgi:hypothetical protein